MNTYTVSTFSMVDETEDGLSLLATAPSLRYIHLPASRKRSVSSTLQFFFSDVEETHQQRNRV